MPLLFMAAATSSRTVALNLQRSLFHVDQPMGGVRAAPLSRPRATAAHASSTKYRMST